ncbi:MAG: ADP-ribosylglycohydrolase family protein [Cyanobacteriota bacterium]
MSKEEEIKGCLLGTAVGDAVGLPLEGVSRNRQKKLFPDLEFYNFFFQKGMFSDDTEHICMTAEALLKSKGDEILFQKILAWKLRFWLLSLPAGIGFATLRSIIKLWLGFPYNKSGVYSAGNGPAMRSPIIGVCYGDNLTKLKQLVKISTKLTHSDPKAEYGALAIAYAAYLSSTQNIVKPEEYSIKLKTILDDNATEFLKLIDKTINSIESNHTIEEFAQELGLENGITGYMYHTVPMVIFCWLKNQTDYKNAIIDIVRCGGDTDSTAAILGAIIGANVKEKSIPDKWINNLAEWPRTVNWIRSLSYQLNNMISNKKIDKYYSIFFLNQLIRNMFFLLIILGHIIRRLFPPY